VATPKFPDLPLVQGGALFCLHLGVKTWLKPQAESCSPLRTKTQISDPHHHLPVEHEDDVKEWNGGPLFLSFEVAGGLLGFGLVFRHLEYGAHPREDSALEVNGLTGIDVDLLSIRSVVERDIKRMPQNMITGGELKLHVAIVLELMSRATIDAERVGSTKSGQTAWAVNN
jgi:hypothetical protein